MGCKSTRMNGHQTVNPAILCFNVSGFASHLDFDWRMNHTLDEYYSYSYKEKEGEMMCEKERKNDRRQIVVTVKETDGMVRG